MEIYGTRCLSAKREPLLPNYFHAFWFITPDGCRQTTARRQPQGCALRGKDGDRAVVVVRKVPELNFRKNGGREFEQRWRKNRQLLATRKAKGVTICERTCRICWKSGKLVLSFNKIWEFFRQFSIIFLEEKLEYWLSALAKIVDPMDSY